MFLGAAVAVIALGAWLLLRGGSDRPAAPHPPSPPLVPPAAPAQPPPAREQFGVSVNRLFNDQFSGHRYAPAQLDAHLAALAATGATIARSDALWSAAEPAPPVRGVHRYDWRFADSIASALAAHELRWLPIVDYSPAWVAADPARNSPPRIPTYFADYAGALAARFGPGGTFWREHPRLRPEPVQTYEIWNEPDNAQFWAPAPDAARYADLYVRARDAILAAEPSSRVVIGGLTNPGAFLPALLRARPDLAGDVDGVAIHPYGPTPTVVFGRVRGARTVLSRIGLGSVPLYVTEFGWTTSPPHSLGWAPASLRGAYIVRTVQTLAHSDCGIAAVVLYTWVTPEQNPADHEDWYGIASPSQPSTPDVATFAAALKLAAARGPEVSLCGAG